MTTDAPTTLWETDVLLQLTARRHALLEQLYVLGRRQLELIDERDMNQLIHVLSAKHHVLAELQQVEKRIDPFRNQDPESRRWRNPQTRESCGDHVSKGDQLLRDIREQEKLAEERLRRHRDEAAARLRLAHSAAQTRLAYSAPVSATGRLDLSTKD
ncbi:MAG TPA: hypothetical protein VNH11_09785 [Pirellulales bacterium]|nr:hypothetical protein [Pirellulales bacterium]